MCPILQSPIRDGVRLTNEELGENYSSATSNMHLILKIRSPNRLNTCKQKAKIQLHKNFRFLIENPNRLNNNNQTARFNFTIEFIFLNNVLTNETVQSDATNLPRP